MTMQPNWFETRINVEIPVEERNIKRSPLGNEISVYFWIGGEQYNVIVPTEVLDEKESTIPAQAIGEAEGNILFCFPATTLGTPMLEIPQEHAEALMGPAQG